MPSERLLQPFGRVPTHPGAGRRLLPLNLVLGSIWMLAGSPCLSGNPELRSENKCAVSMREIDLEVWLSKQEVPDPGDCTFDPGFGSPVMLTAVEYADLDHRPGDEAVVRAQTCFMNTGGADINRVLRLRCAPDGQSWSLEEIPVAPYSTLDLPGQPRSALWLEVHEGSLRGTVLLFAPESAREPRWKLVVGFRLAGNGFEIASETVEELASAGPE